MTEAELEKYKVELMQETEYIEHSEDVSKKCLNKNN